MQQTIPHMTWLLYYILTLPSQTALLLALVLNFHHSDYSHTRLRRVTTCIAYLCALLFLAAARALSKDPNIYGSPLTIILVLMLTLLLGHAGIFFAEMIHIRPFVKKTISTENAKEDKTNENDITPVEVKAETEENALVITIREVVEKQHAYRRKDLTLEGLSTEMGIARTTLSETINREMGMSFRDYIGRVRIHAAQQIWRQNASIPQNKVAKKCGFVDAAALNRKFKQIEGCTPMEWIQREGLEVLTTI